MGFEVKITEKILKKYIIISKNIVEMVPINSTTADFIKSRGLANCRTFATSVKKCNQ